MSSTAKVSCGDQPLSNAKNSVRRDRTPLVKLCQSITCNIRRYHITRHIRQIHLRRLRRLRQTRRRSRLLIQMKFSDEKLQRLVCIRLLFVNLQHPVEYNSHQLGPLTKAVTTPRFQRTESGEREPTANRHVEPVSFSIHDPPRMPLPYWRDRCFHNRPPPTIKAGSKP